MVVYINTVTAGQLERPLEVSHYQKYKHTQTDTPEGTYPIKKRQKYSNIDTGRPVKPLIYFVWPKHF